MKIVFHVLTVTLICLTVTCAKTEQNKEKSPSGIPITLETKSQNAAGKVEKLRRAIVAYKYSGEGVWEKGINVKAGNQFFLNIEKSEPTPLKMGDRLEFKTAGAANVTGLSRREFNGYSSIFVIVDKPLSPDGDGFPNPIYISEDGG